MKKIVKLIFLTVAFAAISLHFIYAQNSFLGKWSAVNSANEEFDFEFRANGTCTMSSHATMMVAEINWKVDQKSIIIYKIGDANVLKLKTVSIDNSTWIFLMDDEITYTCTRKKDPPQPIGTCWCCYDEGSYVCSGCDGAGGKHVRYSYKVPDSQGYPVTYYEEKWIPCDNGDCNNGRIKCTCRKTHKKRN